VIDQVRRVPGSPRISWQGRTNDCGPHALAMAADCLRPGEVGPEATGRLLRFLRVPGLGATPPWGLGIVAPRIGLTLKGRFFGQIADVRAAVDAGRPAIVIVRPDETSACPWYALHYRVALGYRDAPGLPGGGELYFACSGCGRPPFGDSRPGNLAVDYATFARQWRTWLTPRWYAVVDRLTG
jgi:hypothetical protein